MNAHAAPGRSLPDLPGVRHAFYRVGELQLHVAEAGKGPPLVLLHGFPQHGYLWRALIPALATRYRVLCPDLRGYGQSDPVPGWRGYDKETMAADILALLDRLEIRRCYLVGEDWGAWIGFLICLMAPERVERFVAVSMMHPFSSLTLRWLASAWHLWHGMILGLPVLGQRAAQQRWPFGDRVFRWLGADRCEPDAADAVFGQYQSRERAQAAVSMYRAVRRRDFPRMFAGRYRRMAPMQTPTRMLYGTRDKAVQPVHISNYARYAPAMSVETVDCGHSIVKERPLHVLDTITSFFNSDAEGPEHAHGQALGETIGDV